MREKCVILLFIVTVFLPPMDIEGGEGVLSKWTVIYYMCRDERVMEQFIDPLVENLSDIGSGNGVNIVALVDKLERGDTKLYYFTGDGGKVELNDVFGWPDEVDMSDPDTLELYCKQVMQNFSAEHYAFITYAPGGTGWQIYLLPDTSDGVLGISIPAFAETLKNITYDGCRKIDVLYTSCCMSTIELMYEIESYVNYVVTTQEHISGYDVVERFYIAVEDLKNNSNMSAEEFARQAAVRHRPHTFQYFESYNMKLSPLVEILDRLPFQKLHKVMMHSSVAVINLSRISELIEAVDVLSSHLLLNLKSRDIIENIRDSRELTREFGKGYPKFRILCRVYRRIPIEMLSYNSRIDLYDFVEYLKNFTQNTTIRNLCIEVMEQINKSVLSIKKVQNDSAHGLNIYFPTSRYTYNRYILPRGKLPIPYENLRFSRDTKWDEFLREYLNV